MGNGSVLIVDDDPSLLRVLEAAFLAHGYDVTAVAGGRAALDAVTDRRPDVMVLDLGLPDIDGLEVCRVARRLGDVRVVVLSAEGAEDRKVAALDLGADDYLTKPFSTPELMARVRVALRHRRELAGLVDDDVVTLGDLRLDVAAHEAVVRGAPLELTRKQFALLLVLARNPGKVMGHRRLLDVVWGPGQGLDTLRTHVSHLRRKLERAGASATITSEPGVGYRLGLVDDPTA
jgi:two-component system KDP operon response regulator KdpE